jgi:hypothetical protein
VLCADDKQLFRIAKQQAKEQTDVIGSNYLRGQDGKLHIDVDSRKKCRKIIFIKS